ncbi:MAG: hypothetical protein KGZ96_00950 [Clostridia bacterium]|jgi:hypothetical protein|nr:hypothetical protein [Clostridia bacterium]
MTNNKRPPLNIKALNKKYAFNVTQVIKRWKVNKRDAEISTELGIKLYKLACLRKDLENHKFHSNKLISSVFWLDKKE